MAKDVNKKIREQYRKRGFKMDTIRGEDEVIEAELDAARNKSKKKSRSRSRKKEGGEGEKNGTFEGGKSRSKNSKTLDASAAGALDSGADEGARSRSRSRKSVKGKSNILSPEEAGL